MEWRGCLEIPCISGWVWPWAQKTGTTADKLVWRKWCLPKTTPDAQVGWFRRNVGWRRPPPPPDLRDNEGFHQLLSAQTAPERALGSRWVYGRWQPQLGPRCSDPAPSQVCGLSWQKAIPVFCRTEGGMGRCREGWGDREVQAVRDCRNPPLHQVGLPWKLSLGRRKKQSFTSASNTDHVICWAQFLSMYKIPLQGHDIAVYEVTARYPLCTGKTKSHLSGGFLFFFPTQEGSALKWSLQNFLCPILRTYFFAAHEENFATINLIQSSF